MMHTIRLLQSSLQILETGTLDIRCNNRDELLAIKSGMFPYNDLIKKSERLMDQIDHALAFTSLPDQPDHIAAKKNLIAARKKLYGFL